jgi:hypothetical protein
MRLMSAIQSFPRLLAHRLMPQESARREAALAWLGSIALGVLVGALVGGVVGGLPGAALGAIAVGVAGHSAVRDG